MGVPVHHLRIASDGSLAFKVPISLVILVGIALALLFYSPPGQRLRSEALREIVRGTIRTRPPVDRGKASVCQRCFMSKPGVRKSLRRKQWNRIWNGLGFVFGYRVGHSRQPWSPTAIATARGVNAWDFFLSHYIAETGDIVALIATMLEQRGFRPWFNKWAGRDNTVGGRIDVTPEGMQCGVRQSGVFVLFLSNAVFARPFCRLEILAALKARRPIVTLVETEWQRGQAFDFGEAAKDGVPKSFHPIIGQLTLNIGAIPLRRDREEQELMLNKIIALYLEGRGKVLDVDEDTLNAAEQGEAEERGSSPAEAPAMIEQMMDARDAASARRLATPSAQPQTDYGASSAGASPHAPRAGLPSPRSQLLSGVHWPDLVGLAGHDSFWKDLMGSYRRIAGVQDSAFSTSHGAPRYTLELDQPFQHPWRAEQYRRVHLVYRADGHWTVGPVGDAQSGRRGDNLFNRGWIRTLHPSAPGALPGRGDVWCYLGKPRFGRLGLQGKLEIVPYVTERAMWLNKHEPPMQL